MFPFQTNRQASLFLLFQIFSRPQLDLVKLQLLNYITNRRRQFLKKLCYLHGPIFYFIGICYLNFQCNRQLPRGAHGCWTASPGISQWCCEQDIALMDWNNFQKSLKQGCSKFCTFLHLPFLTLKLNKTEIIHDSFFLLFQTVSPFMQLSVGNQSSITKSNFHEIFVKECTNYCMSLFLFFKPLTNIFRDNQRKLKELMLMKIRVQKIRDHALVDCSGKKRLGSLKKMLVSLANCLH